MTDEQKNPLRKILLMNYPGEHIEEGDFIFSADKSVLIGILNDELECWKVPSSVKEILPAALRFTDINQLEVEENHPCFAAVDGVLFSKDMKTLIYYPPSAIRQVYRMPEGVEKLAPGAFEAFDMRQRPLSVIVKDLNFPLRQLFSYNFIDPDYE